MSWREEAHLQQYGGQFARPFAELLRLPGCCFQTRRWCSRSGCSPQCRCRRIWGCWGSFQTSSAASGRRGADVPSSATASVWADHVRTLGDVNAEELKAVYPLHRCLVDGDGCVYSALSPEIHHQLLGLVDVWVRGGSPGTNLVRVLTSSSVGRLIVVGDQAYHRCVIGKLTMTLELCVAVQSCVYRSTGVGWERSPAGHQCEDQGRWGVFCPFWPPDLKADVRADKADRTSLLIHGFWLG